MMDSPFSDAEKRFVLAEMIKASDMDVGVLVEFVKASPASTDWHSMQVPRGRNLNECFRAYEAMSNTQIKPPLVPMPPAKRKSIGDNAGYELHQPQPKRLAMSPIETQQSLFHSYPQPQPSPQMQPQPQLQPAQQPHPAMTSTYGTRNVNIQPRPSPNGHPYQPPHPPPLAPAPPSATTAPQTSGSIRKRGRPSKADKDAQARASSSGYIPVAPMPPTLAPQPSPSGASSIALLDQNSSAQPQSTSYHVVSGPPIDPKQSSRKGRPPAVDKTRPRALPETKIESAERSPSVSNLISAPNSAVLPPPPSLRDPYIHHHHHHIPGVGVLVQKAENLAAGVEAAAAAPQASTSTTTDHRFKDQNPSGDNNHTSKNSNSNSQTPISNPA